MEQYRSYDNLGQNQGIRLISCNIRSIYRNQQELELLVHKTDVDIISLQETWERQFELPKIEGMFLVCNTRRTKFTRGGTAIFAKEGLDVSNIPELSCNIEKELEMSGALFHRKKTLSLLMLTWVLKIERIFCIDVWRKLGLQDANINMQNWS